MKFRIPAMTLTAALALAAFDSHAADWLARASKACEIARDSPQGCEKSRTLVSSAIAAASAVAAYVVLERLYPDQQADFEVMLAVAVADIPESQAKADAMARGREAATRVLSNP